MDALPLELKQRVCEYLPIEDLKSLRLTSKVFSAASYRYLLPRVFLFFHPDSYQEVQQIANHNELRHRVTALVIDIAQLEFPLKFAQWLRTNKDAGDSSTGPLIGTQKADARTERALCRARIVHKHKLYQKELMRSWRQGMLDTIALAFRNCPKLEDLVITRGHHTLSDDSSGNKNRRRFCKLSTGKLVPGNVQFAVSDLFRPIVEVARALNSLTLLGVHSHFDEDWTLDDYSIFNNLKHFRQKDCSVTVVAPILAAASALESIGMEQKHPPRYWLRDTRMFDVLSVATVNRIRVCGLALEADEHELARFLLRCSESLQHLKLRSRLRPEQSTSLAGHVRGQLPNLKSVYQVQLEGYNPPSHVFSDLTANFIAENHPHDTEMGPPKIEEGLWEDYEDIFFS
ncbi:hypothetical protein E4T43_03520 [Aureobasidium subglaciale]|nr:hypothetical protein E4T43_03520 [Aureobasidium subglaciale]